jgi:hypothetical protein
MSSLVFHESLAPFPSSVVPLTVISGNFVFVSCCFSFLHFISFFVVANTLAVWIDPRKKLKGFSERLLSASAHSPWEMYRIWNRIESNGIEEERVYTTKPTDGSFYVSPSTSTGLLDLSLYLGKLRSG